MLIPPSEVSHDKFLAQSARGNFSSSMRLSAIACFRREAFLASGFVYVTLQSVANLVDEADRAMQGGHFFNAVRLLTHAASRSAQDVSVHLKLATARRATGDLPGALDALGNVRRLRPDMLSANLMTANIMLAMGRREEAAGLYAKAISSVSDPSQLHPQLQAELIRGQTHVDEDRAWRARIAAIEIEGASRAEAARIDGFRANVLGGPRADGRPGQFQYPGLTPRAFFDADQVPGVQAMAAATDAIIDDFRNVIAAKAPNLVSMVDHCGTGATGGDDAEQGMWSSIRLIAEGKIVGENAALCARTMALHQALPVPAIAGRSPNLMYSLLDPQTRIPAHHGVTNTRLVLHIPLIVPASGCGIRVGTETRCWNPGQAMIFDDTIEHEAWNDSDFLRVVLLGDVWHPELSLLERKAIARIMAV
jgi:aspartate beta-hydroxylase